MNTRLILLLSALVMPGQALPQDRIVRVVTICQEGLGAASLIEGTFARLDDALAFKPDIACLPEDFTRGEPEPARDPQPIASHNGLANILATSFVRSAFKLAG